MPSIRPSKISQQPQMVFDESCLKAMIVQSSFYEFVKAAWPHVEPAPFIDNWHIAAMCEHLQAVTEGKIKKLLINVPPGCSKSLVTSVYWPMWEWARDPTIRWFFASYDQRLSTRDSIRCRTLLETKWYKGIASKSFMLADDNNQKTYFENSFGGYRLATSVGGHGTGEHPHRVVVDDPHRADQAESENERQSVIDWRDLTMSTRGVSVGVRWVIIMQRLHEDDLAGHVLKDGDWEHLCLPMRFEKGRMRTTCIGFNDPRTVDGELLSPKQFNEETVQTLEKRLGDYGSAGQLQQRPQPKGGGLFKDEYFSTGRVKSAPYDANRVIYWDLAHTASKAACRTVGTVVHEKDGEYYIGPVWTGQWDPYERDNKILAAAQYGRDRWGPHHEPTIVIEEEPIAGKDLCRAIIRKLVGFKARSDRVRKSKLERADSYASQCAAGAVHLIEDGTWDIVNWVKEHAAFPNGSFLDRVDSAGGGFNWLANNRRSMQVGRFKILKNYNDPKKKKVLRFMFGTTELLSKVIIEERAILVVIRNPGHPPSLVSEHHPAFIHLLGSVDFEFIHREPGDMQDRWDQPMDEYGGVLPEHAVMRPDQGKQFWVNVLKQRDQMLPAEVVVVVDDEDGDRAKSVAYAAADAMGFKRSDSVFDLAEPEWMGKDEPAPCLHVYQQTKALRNAVVG